MPDPQRRASADSECLLVEGGDILPFSSMILVVVCVSEGGSERKKGRRVVVGEGVENRKRKRKNA